MSAHMGRDLRKLYFVDFIVLGADMLKVMLPVKGDHRHLILVRNRNPVYPSTIGSFAGFFRLAMILRKQAITSGLMGTKRSPFLVLVSSMMYSMV